MLSSILKSSSYITLEASRTITPGLDPKYIKLLQDQKAVLASREKAEVLDEKPAAELLEAKEWSRKIILDAEETAEQLVLQAKEHCDELKQQAKTEIEQWWAEQRSMDQQIIDQSASEGYDRGYESGVTEATSQIKHEYLERITQAEQILDGALRTKEQVIQEAEPFLMELSVAIAEKIVDQQLSLSQEWIIGLIQKNLARRREQGFITICVAPAHYELIKNAREELLMALDSQAELKIVPDARIEDPGCIIRTSFGSVDITVGTQLQEIKAALLQVAYERDLSHGNS